LQDYIDCQRRFYLRYVKQIKWPAVKSEPILENEKYMLEATVLHELIYRYLIGIPEDKIRNMLHSSRLESWWNAFIFSMEKNQAFTNKEFLRLPEFTLIGTINGHRLSAKYDLLMIQPNGMVHIFDWKTSQKKPKREWMLSRMQTKVYPTLFFLSGQHLLKNEITPEDIKMNYWYANQPEQVEEFEFSERKINENINELSDLMTAIDQSVDGQDEKYFPLTEDKHKCNFCVYRSLCGTGVQAGSFDDYEEDTLDEISIDFDQITEVHY
jgi:hypothetical protein